VKIIEINGVKVGIKFSHSFRQIMSCPFALEKRYVSHEKEVFVRLPAERGKALHAVKDSLVGYCLDQEVELETVTDEQVRDEIAKFTIHAVVSEIGDILEWVCLWRDRFRIPKHIYGHEERIALNDEFDECDWDDASYRGIIDLLEIDGDHATIWDWKSQANILSQTDLDVHDQVTMYAWLVSKMYDHVTSFSCRIWYSRYGFYQTTVRIQEDLDRLENVMLIEETKLAEIKSWDPIPGTQCGWCDYIRKCPIACNLSPADMDVIATQEQAIIAAQQLSVMDALGKQIKENLRAYVKRNDNVRIGDNWCYGYRHSTSETWDPKELAKVLPDFELDLAELVNVDSTAMKKLIKAAKKDDPELEEALADITHEKHSTRFGGHKLKKG